jgi:ATP-dependent DNA helicase RecG
MQNESQIIEYKESWRDEYLKWICGFANAQGGRILIGVNDKKEVVGVENAKRLMEDIPNKVRDVLGIIVDVNLHEKDGLDYIEILVDPYPYPINYKGEYHYRTGSTKQELKGAALDQFLLRKRGMTWDAVPQPNMKVEELDSESIEIFKQQAVRSQRMSKADLEGNNRELLEKLHLFEGDYLKRSAALLFHNDPEKFITGAYIKIGFFKTDADLLYQDEIHGSLVQLVRQMMDLLTTKYLKSIISYDDLQRIDKLPVPRSALREAVLNSIVHKSYGSFIPIQISVYDDKLMIWNAAALPTGWTIETLMKKHSSQPYNPEIANAFFRAGEIEAWGRGIERILSACMEADIQMPEWNFDGSGLWVSFLFKNDQKNDQKDVQKKLTERQKDILSLLSSDGTLTIEVMSKRLGISEKTIYRELSLLKANGLIERKGSKTKGEWVVIRNIL